MFRAKLIAQNCLNDYFKESRNWIIFGRPTMVGDSIKVRHGTSPDNVEKHRIMLNNVKQMSDKEVVQVAPKMIASIFLSMSNSV